jgi:puromycin-sensitive aminopeptidase
VLLEQAAHTADLALDGDVAVLNAGGHGFYRVRYSPELLERLQAALPDLAPIERALLVDDTWAAVLAGETPVAAFLELAAAFPEEVDRTVWTTLATALGQIDRIVDGQDRERFRAFVRDLARPAFGRLGWTPDPDEDELTRQRRGTLITLLGVVGDDPEVQEGARERHDQHLADPGALDPNVAAAVVGVVATSGTPEDYEAFLQRFRTVDSPQESLRYLYALAAFPDPGLAQRTLDLTLGHDIRTQNAPFVLLLVLGNRDHGPLAWEHVKAKWEALNEALPHNAIPRMLGGITGLNTPELAADTAAFLADHPVPQGTRVVQQHLERQRVNVALREREGGRVAKALERLRPS